MQQRQLENFFRDLGSLLVLPLKIYITGGVLAWHFGGQRPTEDIDFAIKSLQDETELSQLLFDLAKKHRIALEFSSDISRWGMVGYKKIEKNAIFYKRYGRLRVYYLNPVVWSVGKMGRYLKQDIEDLLLVFKKVRPSWKKLIRVWSDALRESPASSEKALFVKRAEYFLLRYGKEVWGEKFDIAQARHYFEKTLVRP